MRELIILMSYNISITLITTAMKNGLHTEIMRGIKELGLSQQYNVLNFMNSIGEMAHLPNKLLGFSPPVKSQAMKEIRMALVLGPEKIDF